VTDSPYAKPNKAKSSPAGTPVQRTPNQLDSMLGNLQADMSRQGVNTTQKGCCNACDKPIVGQVTFNIFTIVWSLQLFTFYDFRSSPLWVRLGIRSTLLATTATKNWELETSSSVMDIHTVNQTTTISSPQDVLTAMDPFLMYGKIFYN
jgi:hypothetical protein